MYLYFKKNLFVCGTVLLVQIVIDSLEKRIFSIPTQSKEVVSVQRPNHRATKTQLISKFNFRLNRLNVIIANPLVTFNLVWYHLLIIPESFPVAIQSTNLSK
jgi:hypothetical protein